MNSILHQLILQILRPLIRILHGRGIAFGEFSQIARHVYVEAAEQDLAAKGIKTTTSRIAISTGLTRKDVASLRQAKPEQGGSVNRYNRSVRVINGWLHDQRFQTEQGKPAALPITTDGATASFADLVSTYSGDIPYRAMLDELLYSEVAHLDTNQTVHLLTDAYIPRADKDEQLSILGQDVNLLIKTIEHNLQLAAGQPPYFQRKVRYDNLPVEVLAEFQALSREKSMALLIELNNWLAKHDRDHNPQLEGHGQYAAGIGIYYFEEQIIAPPPAIKDYPDEH